MPEICNSVIDHPSAWTGAGLGGKAAITRQLTAAELAGFDDLIARTRHLAPQAVTRQEFDHPAVNKLIAELRSEIMDGRGVILVSGLDPKHFSPEEQVGGSVGTGSSGRRRSCFARLSQLRRTDHAHGFL
jgi:hypothetical protein